MAKSLKKLYELDRSYDWEEVWTPSMKKFTKRRAHRRVRSILNREIRNVHKNVTDE